MLHTYAVLSAANRRMLAVLAPAFAPVTMRDLTDATGLSRKSAYNRLRVLAAHGYVHAAKVPLRDCPGLVQGTYTITAAGRAVLAPADVAPTPPWRHPYAEGARGRVWASEVER